VNAPIEVPAWKLTRDAYRAQRDALPPAIAEASPFQVARMSKRERARYEAERETRRNKATNAALAWEDEVVEAYARGDFDLTTPGVSRDARAVVREVLELQDHALVDAAQAQAAKLLDLAPEAVEVGGIYYDAIGRGPVRVTKKNRKSAIFEGRYGEQKRAIALLHPFPPHALVGRASKLSAAARAQGTHEAMAAWFAQVEALRGAA
jgi:hypothetical protein